MKADNRRDFSIIESPIQSPKPTEIPIDDTISQDTSTCSSQKKHQANSTATLNVHTLSLKKLAPPKLDGHYSLLDEDDSSAFYKDDPYRSAENEDDESTAAASEKDAFFIPFSYFLKKRSSWGLSTKTETSQSEQDSQQLVIQERHWGRKLRLRSRDGSTSWVPTDEERYKISQGFVSEDEEVQSSDASSYSTGSESTATGLSTFVTRNTGTTGGSEETNDTTSAFTGHYTGDSRDGFTSDSESISTNKSIVTGTTEDTSMFSLEVDSTSETSSFYPRGRTQERSPMKRQKRRLIKSEKSILVEVFSDLRLLAETMADEESGLRRTCFACG
jgi:hypothetical protein